MQSVYEKSLLLRYKAIDFLTFQSERLFLWLPVCFAMGVGLYFSLSNEPLYIYTLLAFLYGLFFVWDCRHNPEKRLFALMIAFATTGFFIAQTRTIAVSETSLKSRMRTTEVIGKVIQVTEMPDEKARVDLTDLKFNGKNDWRTPLKLRLSLPSESTVPSVGDIIKSNVLMQPAPPRTTNSGYDAARTLYFERIGGTGYTRTGIEITEPTTKRSIRDKINKRIDQLLPPETGEIAKALITGQSRAILPEIAESYRNAGIAHILSVSGLHMALIAGFVFLLVRSLICLIPPIALRVNSKKIASAIAIIATFGYLQIAGVPISGLRSFIMITLALSATFFNRQAISVVNVAWAALLILLFIPESLLTISFQLSFSAVLALTCAYEAGIDRYIRVWAKKESLSFYLLSLLGGVILTAFIAGLATAPFAVYYFKRIATYTVLGNLLTSAIASMWVMPSLFAAVLLMPFGIDAVFFKAASFGIEMITRAAQFTSSLPNSIALVPEMPFYGFMFAVFGGLWLCFIRGKARLYGLIPFLLSFATPYMTSKPDIYMTQNVFAFRQTDGSLIFTKGKGDKFTRQSWLSLNAQRTEHQIECPNGLCVYEKNGLKIGVTKTKRGAKAACLRTDLDALYVKSDCPTAHQIPYNGSITLQIKNGKIETHQIGNEFRPWSSSYPTIGFRFWEY